MAEQQSPQPQGGCSPNKHTLHPLLQMACCGDLKEFCLLLLNEDRDQLKKCKDQFSNTALHFASRFGHTNIVEEILKGCPTTPGRTVDGDSSEEELPPPPPPPPSGDDEDLLLATNNNGDTAAHQAIRNNHVKIALLLIQKQPGVAEVLSNKHESLLYLAAERSHTKIVTYLLLKLPKSKDDGPNGRTALHAAVRAVSPVQPALSTVLLLFNKRLKLWATLYIVLSLLRKRSGLNSKADNHGDIPLHHAAYMGNETMALCLLCYESTTVNHRNNDGNTPIHMAAMAGHLPVMGLLLQACPGGGAIVNNRGRNALHLAIQCERTDVVGYILGDRRLQGLVYVRDDDGNGPLHLAALHWNLQILRLLLKSGADKLATNNKDQTALDVFLENRVENPTIQWCEALLRLKKVIAHIPKKGDNEKAELHEKELKGHLELNEKVKTVIQSKRQDRSDIMMLTTFIAAITFAAAFAVPGGYRSDSADHPGLPILRRDVAFKIFIASDVITISSSLAALFLSLYVIHDRIDISSLLQYWSAITWLMSCSFVGMTTAFAAGMYAILAPEALWFAISLCTICGSLPFTTFVWARFGDLKLELRKWAIRRSWSINKQNMPHRF